MNVGNSQEVRIAIYQLRYINRLYHMSSEEIAKNIYNDLIIFYHEELNTWADAMELLDDSRLYITVNTKLFASNCNVQFKINL